MICITTPSSNTGVDNNLQIVFPSGFGINSTASNWTVNTSNLPAGATAWPGIGTATNVSGVTVTFPSNDLSNNTQYCFNFSGTNTLTTPSTTGNYQATLRTRNSSGATLDSASVGLSIVTNDQINVSATVAAQPTDFSASIAKTSPSGSIFAQDTTLTYSLTYGSSLSSGTNVTVEADWSLGTIQGNGSPSVDVLSYVIGSASNAYNSTAPVIDTVNRKIDWDITSFPANTSGQTVTFQLKTTNSYTGSSPVTFSVNGRVLGPATQTADSTVSTQYQYNYGQSAATPTPTAAPTSTPTPGPTATPTPTGTPAPTPTKGITPTPTPAIKPLTFSDVSVRTVFSNSATVSVATTIPAGVGVTFGTSTNSLGDKISDPNFTTGHDLTFSGLSPSTTYYFKVNAIDQSGRKITSDIFSLTTAAPSIAPEIDISTLIMTSNNNVLTTEATTTSSSSANTGQSSPQKTQQKVLVLPVSTPYQFTFSLQGHQSVKRVRAVLRSKKVTPVTNKKVLGITTTAYAAEEEAGNVEIQEVQPGVYVGRLIGQPIPGLYELFIQIYDFNGNIQEQKIAEIKIVKPFTIFSDATRQPIEGAKVLLYLYNKTTRTYSLASSNTLNVENPAYSLGNGTVNYVLAPGQYKVEIKAIGYHDKTFEFTIGAKTDDYPQIYLRYVGFNFFNQIEYYVSAALDALHATQTYIAGLSGSIRFFELNALVVTALFVFLTLLSFTTRIHIPILSFISYLRHFGKIQFAQKRLGEKIKGRIYDEKTSHNITNANVFLIDIVKNKIVAHTMTNQNGDFVFTKLPNLSYEIEVLRDGYEPVRFKESEMEAVGLGGYLLSIKKREFGMTFIERIETFTSRFISLWFETLLILSFVFELSLGLVFGWGKVSVFLLFSLLNLFLWVLHISHARSERKFL